MKTTIDIPESTLKDALRLSGAKTKRAAVVHAMDEFIRRKRMSEAVNLLGQSDTFRSHDDLIKARLKHRTA